MTRVFESNGPDIKIRGTASHVAEKYVQLARDARSSGDPVASENYYQHAEHYFRLIAAAQEQFRQNQPQPRSENEMQEDSGDDGDGENYSNFGAEPGFAPSQQQPQQPFVSREQQPREQHREQPRDQSYPSREQQHQPRDDRRDHRAQPQPQYQPQPQPVAQPADTGSVDRLPSFITGSQTQPNGGNGFEGNGHQGGGERYPPRRRRRPQGPRPEGMAAPAVPGDDFNPGNE